MCFSLLSIDAQVSPVTDDVLIDNNHVLLEKSYAGAATKSKVAQLITLLVCLTCLCCEQNATNLRQICDMCFPAAQTMPFTDARHKATEYTRSSSNTAISSTPSHIFSAIQGGR